MRSGGPRSTRLVASIRTRPDQSDMDASGLHLPPHDAKDDHVLVGGLLRRARSRTIAEGRERDRRACRDRG